MDKNKRHFIIKQVIAEKAITTQGELMAELRKRGIRTTQATLSRDMKELGIAWVYRSNGARYMLNIEQEEERLTPLIGLEIERIEANESTIVVKTLPGRAQGVAESIDHLRLPSVLGTLAGDNTILVLPRSVKKIHETVAALEDILSRRQAV